MGETHVFLRFKSPTDDLNCKETWQSVRFLYSFKNTTLPNMFSLGVIQSCYW